MSFQAEQSAEFLSPYGKALLTHTHQDGSMMGHHGHAQLAHGALKTFVAHLSRATRHQRRTVPCNHRAAVATGTGQMPLGWRPDAM
jgi:hypothetical protein